jgi:hypothetical protein
LSHADEVARSAQMWRIADDIWDGWSFPNPWPNGVLTAFDNLAAWAPYAGPGHWPDADMLPFGALSPHPGWGAPRPSRLTQDEERTQFTLWAIARSPLILGGDLTKLDDFERALITNKELIAINQTAWDSHPLTGLPPGFEQVRVWAASTGPRDHPVQYIAIFNLDDKPAVLTAEWVKLGLRPGMHAMHHLWKQRTYTSEASIIMLPAHGSVIYRVD